MLFSPTTLTFAAQTVGTTSANQTALLINNGNQAVTITNITAPFGFAETNNCGTNFPTVPASLNVNQTCTISRKLYSLRYGECHGLCARLVECGESEHVTFRDGHGEPGLLAFLQRAIECYSRRLQDHDFYHFRCGSQYLPGIHRTVLRQWCDVQL